MKKELIVKQTGFKDCAVACLLSIIRYNNEDISKEELSYVVNTGETGTTAYHMIEGMKKIGFEGNGKKLSFEELTNNYINIPFIAHVKNLNYYHFIVIYQINQKKKILLVMDPNTGKKKIDFNKFKEIYLGSVLEFNIIKRLPKITSNVKFKNIILNYIITNKKNIYLIFIFTFIVVILTLINSLYYKLLIDYFLNNQNINILIILFFSFLLIIFIKNIINIYRNKLLIKINTYINKDLTINTIKHVLNLPYHYFKFRPTGEVLSRINSLNDIKDFISNIFINVFINLFLIINSFIILIFINKKLSYIVLFIMIFYNLIIYIFSKILRNKINDLKISDADFNKELIDSIEGYESIKNLNLIPMFLKRLEIKYTIFINKLKNIEIKLLNHQILKDIIIDLLNLIIISIGCFLILKNKLNLSDLILFITLISFFIDPMKELLNLIINYEYSNISFDRVNDILMIKKEELNNEYTDIIGGDIVVQNVSFSYNLIDNIINNISFKINKGNKFLIYGKSGQGKSTLMKIFMKYLTDYDGEIFINNINLKDIKTEEIRNSMVYVSQNERLFSGTLKENIILEREVTEELYEKIIEICAVKDIRNKKMGRNDFMIEDNGFNLSGGERQRIILARALLKNSNYFILDECLSEVDVLLEKYIIKNINKYFYEKTIIYITHKEEIKELFKLKYEC